MRQLGWFFGAAALCLASSLAYADDLADEADFNFEAGAAAYRRGDYGGALERFLVSNRLVPNRNVLYNIARCYDQLGRYAEAFRYFDQALVNETDTKVLASIESELTRIASKVAVLRVSTLPEGATIYIDRRDLGPRGLTPRRLAVKPGQYRVIAEMDGYHPASIDSGVLTLGTTRDINLRLEPILGSVEIQGDPGVIVYADKPHSDSYCVSPCRLELPLGTHQLFLEQSARISQQLAVEVTAAQAVRVSPQLEYQTGSIVVSTDEPNALVEIDGSPKGFTPTVVALPVGPHQLKVSLEGYRSVSRPIEISTARETRMNVELIREERVEAASRRAESVEQTPSSVSLVPRAELTAFAYPTLYESLRGLPGVYFSDNRGYVGIGVRGLGRLNSYGNRILVLVDDVPINDSWLGSAYVGYDALTDLADVERVELVRGPGSAVYGTSAFSGVVNIVTRREATTGAEAGVSTNLDGVARARVRANWRYSNQTGVFASAAIGRSTGRDFYLPEVANGGTRASSPDAESGWARGLDGMQSATLRGRAHSGIWSMQWQWHRHKKHIPNAQFDTTFGDSRTQQTDERGFLELRAEPRLSADTSSVSSVTVNRYSFHGDYARPVVGGFGTTPLDGIERDRFLGHWVTLGERLVHEFTPALGVTLGGEASLHAQVKQTVQDASGLLLDRSNPFRVLAAYGIIDARLGSRVHISAGGRIDDYSTIGSSFNPRVGLVAKPYERGTTKINVGRAFRAPSIYELYYNDGGRTQLDAPTLSPETIWSAELEQSHRFTSTIVGTIAAYGNVIRGLIDTVPVAQSPGSEAGTPRTGSNAAALDSAGNPEVFRFANLSLPIVAIGTEIGLRREWRSGWMASLYYGYTRTRFVTDGRLASLLRFEQAKTYRHVANSPVHSATFKAVAPFLVKGLNLATRVTLEDRRWDRFETAGDPIAQQRTAAAVFWDLVLTAEDPRHHVNFAFGAYNLFDWRSTYPMGRESTFQRTITSNGRTLLASIETRF
jgi:outer membrane receptor protein involved in Fe transport